jgi:hypothetical protein
MPNFQLLIQNLQRNPRTRNEFDAVFSIALQSLLCGKKRCERKEKIEVATPSARR